MVWKKKIKQKGLTLIELLVVITILGVLIGILLSGLSYKRGADKAKAVDIAQWLTIVTAAHQEYALDHGQPNNINDLINRGYLGFKKYDVNLTTGTNITFPDGNLKQCKVWYLDKTLQDLEGKAFCTEFCSILKRRGVVGSYNCEHVHACTFSSYEGNTLTANPGIIVSCN